MRLIVPGPQRLNMADPDRAELMRQIANLTLSLDPGCPEAGCGDRQCLRSGSCEKWRFKVKRHFAGRRRFSKDAWRIEKIIVDLMDSVAGRGEAANRTQKR